MDIQTQAVKSSIGRGEEDSIGAVRAQLRNVRRYYDDNTRAFTALGQGKNAIRRAVWGPDVTSRAEAVHHVDELILAELPPAPRVPRLLDLGCGVGASLIYLAKRRAIHGLGVTLSPVQAARAQLEIEAAQVPNVACREGDFLALPGDIGAFDVAFSIEAFIHSPSAAGYFEQAARVVRPGGKLILCDDFLTPEHVAAGDSVDLAHASTAKALESAPGDDSLVRAFRTGWRVGSLLSIASTQELAAKCGFNLVKSVELTPFLELNRPRDRVVRLLVRTLGPDRFSGEYWHSLVGGDALQQLLLRGVLACCFLVFERRA